MARKLPFEGVKWSQLAEQVGSLNTIFFDASSTRLRSELLGPPRREDCEGITILPVGGLAACGKRPYPHQTSFHALRHQRHEFAHDRVELEVLRRENGGDTGLA